MSGALCPSPVARRFSSLTLLIAGLAVFEFPGGASAGHPDRVTVPFAIAVDVGFGNETFVTGTHRDLVSGGVQPFGVKLAWSPGNVWSGNVAIEAGSVLTYQFQRHAGDSVGYCSGAAVTLGSAQNLTVPAAAGPPYAGKRIRYVSPWLAANVLFRDITLNGSWTNRLMTRIGPGRVASENLHEAAALAPPGSEIEFVFHNGSGAFDNAPAPPQDTPQGNAPAIPAPYQSLTAPYNYRTNLDVFVVQDGQVFNYPPPATVSAPSVSTVFVNSTVAGIPGRNVRILLPRGYVQNPWKRYPVAYFHDGQNVFFPGGAFGSWDADRIARHETSQGRMREAILVAVDNANDYGSDRRREYVPPTDQLVGNGTADKYLQFLKDNVLSTLDYNYRTLNVPGQPVRPDGNLAVGSSLGGLVSTYIGAVGSDVFGKIGVFSPAFWAGPNFRSTMLGLAGKLPLRIYMDIGSAESSGSQSSSAIYWNDAFAVYNLWLADGYAVNSELLFHPECLALHNEAAWSRRLPRFFAFALSPWDEPNRLALAIHPPQPVLHSVDPAGGSAHCTFLAPLGVQFRLWRSPNLAGWMEVASPASASRLWEERTVPAPFPAGNPAQFWRLEYWPEN